MYETAKLNQRPRKQASRSEMLSEQEQIKLINDLKASNAKLDRVTETILSVISLIYVALSIFEYTLSSTLSNVAVFLSAASMFLPIPLNMYGSVISLLVMIFCCIEEGLMVHTVALFILVIANIHTALSKGTFEKNIIALEETKYRLKGV